MTPTDARLTLTIPEAASMLGISKGLAYAMAAENRLPGVLRLGRRLVVSRAALLRALEGEQP